MEEFQLQRMEMNRPGYRRQSLPAAVFLQALDKIADVCDKIMIFLNAWKNSIKT